METAFRRYRDIYDYFDDWILVKSNANHTEIVFGESVAVVWEAAVKVSKKISLSILSPPVVTDIIFYKIH